MREIVPERPARRASHAEDCVISTPEWSRRAAIAACGAFALVVAMGSEATLTQAGLPVRNIRVEQKLPPLLLARALSGRLTPKGGTRLRDDRGR